MRSYYYNSNMTVLVVKYSLPVVKYSLLVAQKHVRTTSTVLRFYYQYSNIYAQYIMTVEDVLQRVYMLGAGIVLAVLALVSKPPVRR